MKHIHNLKTNIPLLMKGRRLTAFFLSVLMLLTALPTTVYAGSVGSSADDKSVGKDTVQNASTTYENVGPGSAGTDVYLTVDNGTIVVGTPTSVILNGSADTQGKYKGDYSVYAKGDISGDQVLNIYPETDMVTMKQKGKLSKSASVSQTKTEFSSHDIVDGMTTTGTISAESLSAGSWNGNFNFVISVNTNPIPDGYTALYEYDLSATENDDVKAYYAVPTKNTTPVNVGASSETVSANLVSSIASLFKPMTAYAATGDVIEYNGVRYELSDEDTLIITGTGEMKENVQADLIDYVGIRKAIEEKFGYPTISINSIGTMERNKIYILYDVNSLTPCAIIKATSSSSAVYVSDKSPYKELLSEISEYTQTIQDNFIVSLPKTVTIMEGVTNVSKNAFAASPLIETVSIPSTVNTINEKAFYNCSSLKNLYLENGTETIGTSAFSHCTSLTSVTIPSSVTTVNFGAFSGCPITTLVLNEGLTKIGNYAFDRTQLTEVTIPSTLVSGDVGTADKAIVKAKDGIAHIKAKEVIFADGIETIKSLGTTSTHFGFEYTTKVTIPNSVTSITARFDNTKINEINIPKNAQLANPGLLSTEALTTITVAAENPYYSSVDGVLFSKDKTSLLNYPCYRIGTSYTIPNGVTNIGYNSFSFTANLTSVVIPDSVTTIEQRAFYSTKLTNITIPNTVTSVGEMAFYACSSLTTATIPNSVTSIAKNAFRNLASGSTIYCQSQAVADLFVAGTNYDSANTTVVVDASKF